MVNNHWLVVSNMNFIFHFIYGNNPSQFDALQPDGFKFKERHRPFLWVQNGPALT